MPEQNTETEQGYKPVQAAQEAPQKEPLGVSTETPAPAVEKPAERIETLHLEEARTVEPAVAPESLATPEPPAKPEAAAPLKVSAAAEPSQATAAAEPALNRDEFDKLQAERDRLVDRLARLQAELENARKRAERERNSDRDFATANVVEQFLPVLDNFELALKADGTAEQLRAGVELIVKKMQDVLRGLHVHAIPALGEEFDPRHHEALGTVERLDLPDQQVAEEIRRGYKLRQRLLRPALVRVVSNPKQKSE